MNDKKIVAAIGELLWDMFPSGKCAGGAPLNFAYWAGKAGCKALLVSAVGRDNLGSELVEKISSFGMDLSALQFNDSPTGTVEVSLSPEGEPVYKICENVAWDNISDTDKAYEAVRFADAVCWGSLAQRTETGKNAILKIIDACPVGCLKVFDINIRQNFYSGEIVEASLERADILKLNEDEWPLVKRLTGVEKVPDLLDRYSISYVICTSGAVKSEVTGREVFSSIPTPKVDVVSTVGAGDSFTATFVAGLLNGCSVEQAHRRAVEVSAEVCRHAGAMY